MITVSKATDYATLFLTQLAMRPQRKWSVSAASQELFIPRRFLANIVHKLAQRHLVETAKGTGGGVTLKRDPDDLSILEIVELFDGQVGLTTCALGQSCGEREKRCTTREFWMSLSEELHDQLEETTLRDVDSRLQRGDVPVL